MPESAAGGTSGPGAASKGQLPEGERAELERLRAENAELRSQPATAPARRRRIGWRLPVASLLIVLGCILAPLSVMAIWTANQVSDTNRYVANISPLIEDPAVQRALTDEITTSIMAKLNIPARTTQAATLLEQRGLPRVGQLLTTFSGPLTGAITGFVHTQVGKIVSSDQFARLWTQLNRRAHAQLVAALSGRGGALSVANGQVQLDLTPFIDTVKSDLSKRGFTLVNQLPAIHPTLSLFSAKYLVKAQNGYRLLNAVKIVLPIVTLLLLALGVYVARNHRRALIAAGLGFAASMLVLAAGLAIFRALYISHLPARVPADAGAVLFDTLVRFIKQGLRVLLVVGLVVAAAAFFTGPSVTAVNSRRGIVKGFDWLRRSGEHFGVSTGPVGKWTYAHRKALRICAVSLAVLIFVFWGQPTGLVVILITVLLLVVLGLIELIGRPPSRPQPAGQPGAG
ncbi:MAG TPA: hypothetical protein VH641_07310 [Streptosporangiaceae bacterium]